MSADKIRRLAGSKAIANCCGKKRGANTPCSVCYENNDGTCEDKEAIHSALLSFAAMVERCEKMYNKFCMRFSVNSDKAKTNPQFMKVAILLDDMFNYILKGATDERK